MNINIYLYFTDLYFIYFKHISIISRHTPPHTHNPIKSGFYFKAFNFWNGRFKVKVIKNSILLACTCEDTFTL